MARSSSKADARAAGGAPAPGAPEPPLSRGARLAIAAVLAGAFVMRARMLEVPLGRDEGVYAYIAWLILHDVPLYTSTVDLQMPGLWVLYSLFMRFLGTSGVGIHLGLLIANVASTWFVFLLGRRWVSARGGVIAAACFAAATLSQRMLGFTANAEHFVVVFALAGIALLERALANDRSRDVFLAGVLLGLGLMMKQHGVFFVAFGGGLVLYAAVTRPPRFDRVHVRRVLLYGAGALAPFALASAWFAARGVFGEFLFWAFRYSSTYGFDRGVSDAIDALRISAAPIVPRTVGFLVLLAIGFADQLRRAVGVPADRDRAILLLGFFVLTVASVFPGLVFRHHYFLRVVPAAALLCAAAVETLLRLARIPAGRAATACAALLTALAIGQFAWAERTYLFRLRPDEIARHTYQLNPIVELREIGAFIRRRTTPADTVAVMGSEPQIYLYANRRSASTLIVMYPMMWAPPEMALELQRRTIDEIEAARPKIIVVVDNPTSWAFEEYSDPYLVRWLDDYVRRHYGFAGVVEVNYPQPSVIIWGPEAADYQTRSNSVVRVFERRPSAPAS